MNLCSVIDEYIPENPFFNDGENRRRGYLMDKYFSNLYAVEDGNSECKDNLEKIKDELDEIFYAALDRRRGSF